jgi:thiol-disulfide isomerase/thioredoxin
MRLRPLLAVPALVAALLVSSCSSGRGGNANYDSGSGGGRGAARTAYVAAPAAPAPAPAPTYARSGRGNTAYIFVAGWCGYCQKLKRNTLSSPDVQAELANFNAQQIDPDSATGRPLASQYGVSGFPTTVIVNPSGAVVKKIVGYSAPADYVSQLRSAR